MIDDPGVSLIASLGTGTSRTNSVRASRILERIQATYPDWSRPIEIDVQSEIPPHQGLGSGTQLGMAIAEAVAALHGESKESPRDFAEIAGRGARSAIGLHGYLWGGFLVDAGHRSGETVGEIATRTAFPDNWQLVLISPRHHEGASGSAEAHSFARLAPMDLPTTGTLCRLALTEILPALRCGDFFSFAGALGEYGQLIGRFFSPVQGGPYTLPQMETLVQRLQAQGYAAVAQSSWGPTVCVVVPDGDATEQIVQFLSEDGFGRECQIRCSRGLNRGRQLFVTS